MSEDWDSDNARLRVWLQQIRDEARNPWPSLAEAKIFTMATMALDGDEPPIENVKTPRTPGSLEESLEHWADLVHAKKVARAKAARAPCADA
jgi:hypothetical protein